MATNFFNPFGRGALSATDAFEKAQGFSTGQESKTLQQDVARDGITSPSFKKLSAIDADSAIKLKGLLKTDDQGLDAAFQDAAVGRSLLQNDRTGQSALQFFGNRIQAGESQGRDMFLTKQIFSTLQQDPQAALTELNSFLDIPNQLKALKGGDTKTATQKDFSTFQDLMQKAKESGSEADKKKAERFGRAARFIRETEQEKADIKVTQKEREAIAKANVARRQGFVNSGIEAANGAANVKRALTLLDEVETGGFDNLALKARRLFGIEGADEGELSNLMGKAVLAQLKPIFGAAFTAREGDALAELEAKFSNSAKSNKRLLENALKIIDRAARRGIAAAEDQGDNFTANEIRDAMAFKLEDKDISVDEPTAPQSFNFDAQGNLIQ